MAVPDPIRAGPGPAGGARCLSSQNGGNARINCLLDCRQRRRHGVVRQRETGLQRRGGGGGGGGGGVEERGGREA